MDKLFEVANYYKENLDGKKFHLQAAKKGKLIDLEIVFGAEHFKHLTGLHKLTDIQATQAKSEILYHRILNKEISMDNINSSSHLSEMGDRLEVFNKLKETLLSPNLMLKSSHGRFRGVTADFLLVQQKDKNNIHLFLKGDNEGIVIPVTYFQRQDNVYLRTDSARWTVLSVEEVKKSAQQDQMQQRQKPRSNTQAQNGAENAQKQISSERIRNDNTEKLVVNNEGKLDFVAATMVQCDPMLSFELAREKERTQKENPMQQVGQVEQSQQVQKVERARQVGQVKQKSKSNNGSTGKR